MQTDDLKPRHPPFDPDLDRILRATPQLSISVKPQHIEKFRAAQRSPSLQVSDEALRRGGAIDFEEIVIPSSHSEQTIRMLVLRPARVPRIDRSLCFLHGGGMFAGNARTGIEAVLDWVETLGLTVFSVDYRLAPEHPHPAPVEDCYAAVSWVDAHREMLGIGTAPLILSGASAGGGLAAGVALLARERGGLRLSDLILMCPMLDDRARFPSSTELDGDGTWDQHCNRTGWEALLGDNAGGTEVPPSAAPGRAADLHGLPATFLDVGAVETFRDEVVDFGTRLAQAGVSVELHLWAGAFHGFDLIARDSAVAKAAHAARLDYLQRRLTHGDAL